MAYGALHEFPKETSEIVETIMKETNDKNEENNEKNEHENGQKEEAKKEEKDDVIEEDII